MAGFGMPLRAGQILAPGRFQRMQQGSFIQTTTQGLFDGEIHSFAGTDPSPNTFDLTRWFRTGHMATVFWLARFESGFSPGSGIYLFSIPIRPDPEYLHISGSNDYGHRVGDGRIRGTGSDSRVVVAQMVQNNEREIMAFLSFTGTNDAVSATFPFTFAADDAISLRMRYPADPRIVP